MEDFGADSGGIVPNLYRRDQHVVIVHKSKKESALPIWRSVIVHLCWIAEVPAFKSSKASSVKRISLLPSPKAM